MPRPLTKAFFIVSISYCFAVQKYKQLFKPTKLRTSVLQYLWKLCFLQKYCKESQYEIPWQSWLKFKSRTRSHERKNNVVFTWDVPYLLSRETLNGRRRFYIVTFVKLFQLWSHQQTLRGYETKGFPSLTLLKRLVADIMVIIYENSTLNTIWYKKC